MCLRKSPRKISGLHFRTCHSICFAVGDSMGKMPSISGVRTASVGAAAASAEPRDGRRVPLWSNLSGKLWFFLEPCTVLCFVGAGSQRVLDCMAALRFFFITL